MLQCAMYVRGVCENARSSAPVQCKHAASIVTRTRAPKILFPEATCGPQPSSAAPLTQAGNCLVTSYVRLPRLRVSLRGVSCLDSTSILEAARVELKRVLSRYKVPSPLRRRVRGKGARPKPLRPQCRGGSPDIARSPASIVCRRGVLIIL